MSKYIKPETKGQIIFVVAILLAIIAGLVWAGEQSFHAGSWEE